MIDVALKFLLDELNAYVDARTNHLAVAGEERVVINRIVDEGGHYAFGQERLCATVINIEEDRFFKSQIPDYTYTNGQHLVLEPDLKLTLTLLFAANYTVYKEGLKFLSHVMTFFQSHSTFSSEAQPALDTRIGKLNVELLSLTFEQLNQVWAFIGAKQLPSVAYKVRVVILQDELPARIGPPIKIIHSTLHR